MPDKQRSLIKITGVEAVKEGVSKSSGRAYSILGFSALLENKELMFKTLSKSLFEFIKPDAEYEAEYEVQESQQYGTSRTVSMLYKDGKPVVESKPRERQWRGNEDSPEKRTSIERQSCLSHAVTFMMGKPDAQVADVLETAEAFALWVATGKIMGGYAPNLNEKAPEPPNPMSDTPALVKEAEKLGAKVVSVESELPKPCSKEQWQKIKTLATSLDKVQIQACAQKAIGKSLVSQGDTTSEEADKMIKALETWKK